MRVIRYVAMSLVLVACKSESPIPDDIAEQVPSDAVHSTLSDFEKDVRAPSASKSSAIQALLHRCVAAAGILIKRNHESGTAISSRYFKSLNQDIATVRDGLQAADRIEAQTLVNIGTVNLEIKATHATHRRNWAELVRVRVHTRRGRMPVRGLSVLYCQRGGGRVHFYWRSFFTKSTPAVDDIPPGIYDVAVENEPSIVITIGAEGQNEQSFIMQVH